MEGLWEKTRLKRGASIMFILCWMNGDCEGGQGAACEGATSDIEFDGRWWKEAGVSNPFSTLPLYKPTVDLSDKGTCAIYECGCFCLFQGPALRISDHHIALQDPVWMKARP